MNSVTTNKMTNYRWVICAMLFLATTVNYMDRQVLSLTWKDFIAIDFHWTLCRQIYRLDGYEVRLHLGYRCLESWCLYACRLRMGNHVC